MSLISIGPYYEIWAKNSKELLPEITRIMKTANTLDYIRNTSMLVLPVIGDTEVIEDMHSENHKYIWQIDRPWTNVWWMAEYKKQAIMQ